MQTKAIAGVGLIMLSNLLLAEPRLDKNAVLKPVPVQNATLAPHFYPWTGFFVTGVIGGVFNAASVQSNNIGFFSIDESCNKRGRFANLFPGLQAGYSHQFDSKIVLGIETAFIYHFNSKGALKCDCYDAACSCPITPFDQFDVKNRGQLSLRARLGYALDNFLPFVVIGDNISKLNSDYHNEGGDYYGKNTLRGSWLSGAGLEWILAHNWSARVEYNYTDYGKLNLNLPRVYGLYDPNSRAQLSLRSNQVNAALSYWF